jgi:hypothetical protein
MLRFYILHSFGGFALVELNKKGKITSYGPIKNLSLVAVGLTNLGPTFATASWAVLAE